jgi:hypothetical protein
MDPGMVGLNGGQEDGSRYEKVKLARKMDPGMKGLNGSGRWIQV